MPPKKKSKASTANPTSTPTSTDPNLLRLLETLQQQTNAIAQQQMIFQQLQQQQNQSQQNQDQN